MHNIYLSKLKYGSIVLIYLSNLEIGHLTHSVTYAERQAVFGSSYSKWRTLLIFACILLQCVSTWKAAPVNWKTIFDTSEIFCIKFMHINVKQHFLLSV